VDGRSGTSVPNPKLENALTTSVAPCPRLPPPIFPIPFRSLGNPNALSLNAPFDTEFDRPWFPDGIAPSSLDAPNNPPPFPNPAACPKCPELCALSVSPALVFPYDKSTADALRTRSSAAPSPAARVSSRSNLENVLSYSLRPARAREVRQSPKRACVSSPLPRIVSSRALALARTSRAASRPTPRGCLESRRARSPRRNRARSSAAPRPRRPRARARRATKILRPDSRRAKPAREPSTTPRRPIARVASHRIASRNPRTSTTVTSPRCRARPRSRSRSRRHRSMI